MHTLHRTAQITATFAAKHCSQTFQSTHFADSLHGSRHFLVHFDQLVDILHRHAGAFRNAYFSLCVQQFRLCTLFWRHGANDGVHVNQKLVVHATGVHRRLGLFHARHHSG